MTRSPIATLPSTAGGDNVAQEPHCGVLEVVGGVQVGHELHDNLPVTVDVKLDQEPHGSLADAVGVKIGDEQSESDASLIRIGASLLSVS